MGLISRKAILCDSCDEETPYFGSEIPAQGWFTVEERYTGRDVWICPSCIAGFTTINEAIASTGFKMAWTGVDWEHSRIPAHLKGRPVD